MKTLEHEGFLRGPGLLQLETIRRYFDIINEKPMFKAHKKKVTDFCSEGKAVKIIVRHIDYNITLYSKRKLANRYSIRLYKR